MNAFRIASICVLAGIFQGVADAGTPHLVKDINLQNVTVSSFPTDYYNLGGWSYVDATDNIQGYEPWLTDGTPQGTFNWGDVTPGAAGAVQQTPVLAGTHAFVMQFDRVTGTTIWVTDFTPQSSRALSTLPISAGQNPGFAGVLGSRFLFTLYGNDGYRHLWITDGTDAGTHQVDSADGTAFSVSSTLAANGKLYFLSGTSAGTEPWVSDGTTAGTARLAQIPNAMPEIVVSPTLGRAGKYLVFPVLTSDTGREVWRIDLDTNAVTPLLDIAPGAGSGIDGNSRFGSVGNLVVFAASATGDTVTELWRSDGTSAGTYPIASVVPWIGSASFFVGDASMGALLFYVAGAGGVELWGTDGSAAGTQRLVAAYVGVPSVVGGHFYFPVVTANNAQLWTSDGTLASTNPLAGTPILTDGAAFEVAGNASTLYLRTRNVGSTTGNIDRYDLNARQTTRLLSSTIANVGLYPAVFGFGQGHLYFDNEDLVNGRELWVSDGTQAGTHLLKNIASETQTQSSAPADFVNFNGQLFFTANDGVTGREIWHSDGTAAGTLQLSDLNPGAGGSAPSDLFVANGALYFFATDASGVQQLWRSDGSRAGTAAIAVVSARPPQVRDPGCDSKGVVMGGAIYFAGFDPTAGMRLWKTDGTTVGTIRLVGNPAPAVQGAGVCSLTAQGSLIYFAANDASSGMEPWVSDGTPQGTKLLADLAPGLLGSSPTSFTPFNDRIYFLANDGTHGQKLWSTDGTSAATRVVDIFGTGTPLSLQSGVGNRLLLSISNGINADLWNSDGTSAGSQLVKAQTAGAPVYVNQGRGYFALYSTVNAARILTPWVTDGTPNGTISLIDVNAGTSLQTVDFFENFNGITLFETRYQSVPSDLWRTNGTIAGTAVIGPGSIVSTRLAAGQNLFYLGNNGTTGDELYALDNRSPVATADSIGNVTAGSSTQVNVIANDADPDGAIDPSSVHVVNAPAHGTASSDAAGVITYAATAGYSGSDSFTYQVADDQGATSAPVSVQVNVVAPPPPPPPPPAKGGGGGGILGFSDVGALLGLLLLVNRRRRPPGYPRGYVHAQRLSRL